MATVNQGTCAYIINSISERTCYKVEETHYTNYVIRRNKPVHHLPSSCV